MKKNNQQPLPINLEELKGVLVITPLKVEDIEINLKVLIDENVIGFITDIKEDIVTVTVNNRNYDIVIKDNILHEYAIRDLKTHTLYTLVRSQWNEAYAREPYKIYTYFLNEYNYGNNKKVIRAKFTLTNYPKINLTIEKKQIINIIYVLEKSKSKESLDLAKQLRTHYKIYGNQTAIKKRVNGKTYSNKIEQKNI